MMRTIEEYDIHGPYAWPGGYPVYAIMDDGALLCYDCTVEVNCDTWEWENVHEGGPADGWRFEGADVYYEGPTEFCAHCNKELESAYGDPEEEMNDDDS